MAAQKVDMKYPEYRFVPTMRDPAHNDSSGLQHSAAMCTHSLVEHTPLLAMLHAQMYSVQMLSNLTCHHVWGIGTSEAPLAGSFTSLTTERMAVECIGT
jgi:hypothetical protein